MSADPEDSTPGVTADHLFVGLTRPTTMFGVPFNAFLINAVAAMCIFMVMKNPLYLAIGLPTHFILRAISADNPRVFAEMAAWVRVNAKCDTGKFWGAVSFAPHRTKKWR